MSVAAAIKQLTMQRMNPLHEVLPYWEIHQGVLFLYTGQAEVGVELRLPATTLAPEGTLRRLHNALTSVLRHAVPEGERLRMCVEVAPLGRDILDVYERNLNSAHQVARRFSRHKAEAFEAARRRGELREYRAYLTCTVLQPGRRKAKKRPTPKSSLTPDELTAWFDRALSVQQRLVEMLLAAGMTPRPIFSQGMFELLWRYWNPNMRLGEGPHYQSPQVYLPHRYVTKEPARAPATLRTRLVGSEISHHHWDYLRIGPSYAGMISMGSLPTGFTQVSMVERFLNLPGLYWLVMDYRHEPLGRTTRALEAKARRFHAAEEDAGGFSSYVDASVRAGAAESDEAMQHHTHTGAHPYQLGVSMIVLERDAKALRDNMQRAINAFTQLPGVTPYQENVALLEQYLAVAPGSGRLNERMHLVFEDNAADFVPLNGPWRGSGRPVMMLLNRWNAVTALDPFDPSAPNWNGIVIGGSGSGKTFTTQLLINEALREDADVMILDRGYGYAPLTDMYGGAVIPFDASGSVSINPFDLPVGEMIPDDTKKSFLMALLRAMMPSEQGVSEAIEDAILSAAIQQTYARARSERKIDGVTQRFYAGAKLSDLVRVLITLEEIGERPASVEEKQIARSLALRLQQWVGDTPFGRLVDRDTSVMPDAPIMYYETSNLEGYPQLQNVATLLIAEEVWKRVKRNPERRKIVVLDEFWALLNIPKAAAFMVELYRRLRRYNAAAWAVTQSLKDFAKENAQGILQNTSFHFLLPLPGEDRYLQELLKLPDSAMQAFHSLAGGEHYRELLAWIRRDGRLEGDVLRVVPRPIEYWAFTTNADDMVARDKALEKHNHRILPALEELARQHPYGVRGERDAV